MMNYVQYMRRPGRQLAIIAAVLAINGGILWVLLQWQVYTPAKPDGLIHVTIVPKDKPAVGKH